MVVLVQWQFDVKHSHHQIGLIKLAAYKSQITGVSFIVGFLLGYDMLPYVSFIFH